MKTPPTRPAFFAIAALLLAAALLLPTSARAADLIQPSAVTSSTAANDLFPAINLINGSGLSGTPTPSSLGTHADASSTTAWVTHGTSGDYYTSFPVPVLTFTLPAPARQVSELVMWGYSFGGPNKNEGKTFSVTFSTDGTNFGSEAVVTKAAAIGQNAVRLAFPDGPRLATHVRVAITDNHYDGSAGGDRVGLGEVRFIEPTIRTVTALSDGAGSTTLRNTIAAADPGDIIQFGSGLNGFTIRLTAGTALVINKSLTIDASSLSLGLTISGDVTGNGQTLDDTRVFEVGAGHTVILDSLTITGGRANDSFGGGIYNFGGILTVRNCTLTGNFADRESGAIENSAGILTVSYSTISGNSCGIDGGGIGNFGSSSKVTLDHTTVSGNVALGSNSFGGGIYNAGNTITLNHATVANNTAGGFGGGISSNSSPLILNNSIVAGNSAGTNPDISKDSGTATALGVNFIGNTAGSSLTPGPTILTGNANLAGLGTYAGPTRTMPPLPGSPAINAADRIGSARDQRGLARGAYVYENDFSQLLLPTLNGATVVTHNADAGTGTVDSGSFRLTPETTGRVASLVLPVPGAFSTFAASFDLFYSDPVAPGPADGMSFSFGPPPPTGFYGAESGVPGAHRISFNVYNGNDATNAVLSYINPAGTTVASTTFPRFGDANQWHRVTVTLDATGRLRVTYKGALVLNVPAIGYTHVAGHTFTFAARTGGDVSEQRVDNIGIVTDPPGGAPDIGAVERGLLIPGFTPVVTSIGDTYDGLDTNGVSLREAVDLAPAAATITFAPGLSGQTITLDNAEIILGKNVTIDGSALTPGVIVDGGPGTNRIFTVNTGQTVALTALTLTGGDGGGTFSPTLGGAILNRQGILTVSRCTLAGNTAVRGGALFSTTSSGFINSHTTLVQCTLTANGASANGGAIRNDLGLTTLRQCTIAGNIAPVGNNGGGVSSAGFTDTRTDVQNSIISGNTGGDVDIVSGSTSINSFASLGGNLIGTGNGTGDFNQPGDFFNSTPLLAPLGNYSGPTFTMIPLPGSPAIDAGGSTSESTDQRGFARVVNGDGLGGAGVDIGAVERHVSLVVTNLNDSGTGSLRSLLGFAASAAAPGPDLITFAPGLDGGTISLTTFTITISDTSGVTVDATALPLGLTIDDGAATSYRLFLVHAGSIVTMRGLTLANGGGPGFSGVGGAIANDVSTLTLERCTLAGNSAHRGGAIFSATPPGFTTLKHCTLSGNSATIRGGAIENNIGSTTLTHCTVSGNASDGLGGGVASVGDAFTETVVENSIIAGNGASDVDLAGATVNSFSSFGHNLIGTGSATARFNQPGDTINNTAATIKLAPLGEYGGPTLTMVPLPGSPAIDAAPASTEALDQRGLPRPVDGDAIAGAVRDIGAAEFSPALDLAAFWTLDFDGDGNAFGIEHAVGTNVLVSDAGAIGNLTTPAFNLSGDAELTFGLNPAAAAHTIWILRRSTTLLPGSFMEIYRFDGPSQIETLQPGIDSDFLPPLSPTAIKVIDQNPPAGKAFYRFEAQPVP